MLDLLNQMPVLQQPLKGDEDELEEAAIFEKNNDGPEERLIHNPTLELELEFNLQIWQSIITDFFQLEVIKQVEEQKAL